MNFGDGETSTDLSPVHTYANPGEYIASVTITTATETQPFETLVTIFDTPIANAVVGIAICDDDNDGINSFDFISDVTPTVLGTQVAASFTVTYHPTQTDADDNTNAYANPYSNTLTQETVFVRIENTNNIRCFDTSSFGIEVFETPVPPVDFEYYQCDYTNSGDLIEPFDLTTLDAGIANGQNLSITHYETLAEQLRVITQVDHKVAQLCVGLIRDLCATRHNPYIVAAIAADHGVLIILV